MISEIEFEEKLDKTENLFGWLWELSVDGMRILDSSGRIMIINDAYSKIVEIPKEKLVGKLFSVVYAESERERILTTYRNDAQSNRIKTHFERENVLWNGNKRWFDFSNSFVEIPETGKVTLSIIKDITERKKSEIELIESEKKFRLLFNSINDAVFVIQLSSSKTYGDFVEVNDVALNQLGYSKEEFLKLSPSAIIQPKFIDEFNKAMEKLKTEKHVIYELVHKAKDRKLYTVEVNSHLFEYEGKPTVLSIARDITERKQSEEKLKKTSSVLRNLASHLQSIREEERSLIAREIHDDLGQTLTVLKINVSLLSNKLRKDQKQLKEKVDNTIKLIDDAVERVQRITAKLRPGILDELGIIPAIEWQAQEFQNLTGIKCMLSLPEDEIKLDAEKSTAVFRIFQEALTNVLRHASASWISAALKISDDILVLEINDNGIGISSEKLKDPRSLGIIGMKERALILGGEVSIEGIQDKGTRVRIEIPMKDLNKD